MSMQDPDIRNLIQKAVGTSYVPTIILNDKNIELLLRCQDNVNNLIKDKDFLSQPLSVQNWILTSLSTGAYANAFTKKHSPLLDAVWNVISDFVFPGKKLRKTRENIQKYIDTAKKEHNLYIQSHELFLQQVQAQVDVINKRKPIMKDYILQKVVTKLQGLGIDSQLGDYPMEFVDYRSFKLNQEFGYINKQFEMMKNDQYARVLELIPVVPINPLILILPIIVNKKMKEVENDFSQMKKQTESVFAKMSSDNQKIKNLSLALGNIAKIYTEINSKFIPAIEGILNLITQKYQKSLE